MTLTTSTDPGWLGEVISYRGREIQRSLLRKTSIISPPPPSSPPSPWTDDLYSYARREYAFRLYYCDGLILREIGGRLGISNTRATSLIWEFIHYRLRRYLPLKLEYAVLLRQSGVSPRLVRELTGLDCRKIDGEEVWLTFKQAVDQIMTETGCSRDEAVNIQQDFKYEGPLTRRRKQ